MSFPRGESDAINRLQRVAEFLVPSLGKVRDALTNLGPSTKLHADIAHPINSTCREKIQGAVLASYADELERSKMPGYVSRYDDLDGGEFDLPYPNQTPETAGAPGGEPPVRRGPLRGHTQHNRSGILRGPHVAARREMPSEGMASADREAQGFGGGL